MYHGARGGSTDAGIAAAALDARLIAIVILAMAGYCLLHRVRADARPDRSSLGTGSVGRRSDVLQDPHSLLYESPAEYRIGLEDRLSPEARVRYMAEMMRVVTALETRVARPVTAGAVGEAVKRVRAFCRHAYRVLGRDAKTVSVEDARTALADAALLQSRAINSMACLFMTTVRDRTRRALSEASDNFAASSEAHISEMRRVLDSGPGDVGAIRKAGRSGAYEPGRGFPAPWGGADSERNVMYGAGAEARYRVATEH